MPEYYEQTKKKIYVSPCVRCGGTDIKIHDCGYSSFNAGNIKCNSCGYEVVVPGGADSEKEYIRYWNETRHRLRTKREELQKEISELDQLLSRHPDATKAQ